NALRDAPLPALQGSPSIENPLRSPADTLHAGNVAMGVIAGVILQSHIVALVIDETRLPIPLVHGRIVDGDDVFQLSADPADPFGGRHFIAVRQAARIE